MTREEFIAKMLEITTASRESIEQTVADLESKNLMKFND